MLVMPRFWVVGPSDQVARRGPATSLRAQGEAPIIQAELMPLAETYKELARQIQVEELAVEEDNQGRDAPTLEVVIKAAGPLMYGQLEGLGVLPRKVVAPP